MAAFASSYIKTEASQVTRSADAASMTGANFSSWYRADEGTMYAESAPLVAPLVAPGRPIFHLRSLSGNSQIDLRYRPSQKVGLLVITNSVVQADTSSSANYTTAAGKLTGAYATNNVASTLNAEAVQTDTSVTLPTDLETCFIGRDPINWFNGHIRRISYYPARLTNAQLQSLTTV